MSIDLQVEFKEQPTLYGGRFNVLSNGDLVGELDLGDYGAFCPAAGHDCIPAHVILAIADKIREVERSMGITIDPNRDLIESRAKEIYSRWKDNPGYVPWQDGGNSDKQEEARDIARLGLPTCKDRLQVEGEKPPCVDVEDLMPLLDWDQIKQVQAKAASEMKATIKESLTVGATAEQSSVVDGGGQSALKSTPALEPHQKEVVPNLDDLTTSKVVSPWIPVSERTPETDASPSEKLESAIKKYTLSFDIDGYGDKDKMDEAVSELFHAAIAIKSQCASLRKELDDVRKSWRSDQKLFYAALRLLNENGIAAGSQELIAAAKRSDELREALERCLKSAKPNQLDNPTMLEAWEGARKILAGYEPTNKDPK